VAEGTRHDRPPLPRSRPAHGGLPPVPSLDGWGQPHIMNEPFAACFAGREARVSRTLYGVCVCLFTHRVTLRLLEPPNRHTHVFVGRTDPLSYPSRLCWLLLLVSVACAHCLPFIEWSTSSTSTSTTNMLDSFPPPTRLSSLLPFQSPACLGLLPSFCFRPACRTPTSLPYKPSQLAEPWPSTQSE
jgi:hypothetical protein